SLTPPPPTALPTLPLHDALPISELVRTHGDSPSTRELGRAERDDDRDRDRQQREEEMPHHDQRMKVDEHRDPAENALREDEEWEDRKSTRLNSSHDQISYAVFCL